MTTYILTKYPLHEELTKKIQRLNPTIKLFSNDNIKKQQIPWNKIEITIGWSQRWQQQLLAKSSALKWVQVGSAGIDHLPLKKFQQKKVLLSNGSGIHAQSISDHLLALLFMQTRGIFKSIQLQQQKSWAPSETPYAYLSDQTILIVGTGQIGQKLAAALNYFSCYPIGINTTGHPAEHFKETYPLTELSHLAAKADFIINILPLTVETNYIYDENFFKAMKKSASFYNVGRGDSVDTSALIRALQTKKIAFAALDVFEEEPLPSIHPLWSVDNLLITPHISGKTPHFQKAFSDIFLTNLKAYLKNQSLQKNAIDLSKGY